jgi:hypothetical protein
MFKAIKAYRLGKRIESLFEEANAVLFVKFTAIQESLRLEQGVALILMSFVFEDDFGNENLTDLAQQRPEIEGALDQILRHEPDLKELLSAALFLKLNICRAHGNKQLFDKMLASRVFTKYSDLQFKLDDEGLDRLEALIARIQSTFFR